MLYQRDTIHGIVLSRWHGNIWSLKIPIRCFCKIVMILIVMIILAASSANDLHMVQGLGVFENLLPSAFLTFGKEEGGECRDWASTPSLSFLLDRYLGLLYDFPRTATGSLAYKL